MQNSLTSNRNALTLSTSLVAIAFLLMATTVAHAQSPDFGLASTPSNLCVNPGVNGVAQINVSSLGGFAGTVQLSSNVDPTVTNGPTLSPIPSSETLAAGQSVSFNLAISTTTSTPLYAYTITVSGLNGALYHTATLTLTVAAGCSVGGLVVSSGLASPGSFLALGLVVSGLVGLVGVAVAVRTHGRKLIPDF